ncbi:hypothetical protein HB912_03745 [Listeria aquatica]|uniref:YolD-like family protein n=1 Tax=Listeria aquatica TaxID=1494960 RepID=A0A841ZQ40_9LIST|nr:hypothetical protein [Listeria aquatica]MBC1520761.1 hypothetical protein [Listeria aquatica]
MVSLMNEREKEAEEWLRQVKKTYIDRGMMKWSGFYLSDHTAQMEEESQKRKQIFVAKNEMSLEQIGEVLEEAFSKGSVVSLQMAELNEEHMYEADLTGKVISFLENRIYLQEKKGAIQIVSIEKIRHAEIVH